MAFNNILLVNIDCDEAAAGMVHAWLNDKFANHTIYSNLNSLTINVDVVVLVSNSWEKLIEAKRNCTHNADIYVCGVCLGQVPEPLTQLPNFTIHSGGDIFGGLLYDVETALKERITT